MRRTQGFAGSLGLVLGAWTACFVALQPASALAAGNPQIAVQQIQIVAGKLIIAGTSTVAGKVVTVQGTSLKATANGQLKFAFNLTYRTNDCLLTLVTNTGSLDNLMIGNCAPGFTAKGAWTNVTQYALNDIVTRLGQTYRAKTANVAKAPEANVANWELFAAKGVIGPQGIPGANGTNGTDGTNGLDGAQGAAGPQGPSGVVSIVSLTMSSPVVITLTTSDFTFVGTTSDVALDGTERLTGTVSAMLTNGNSLSTVFLGLCYRLLPSGPVTLFTADTFQSIYVSTGELPKPFQASATSGLLGAGAYTVGACAKYSGGYPGLTRNNGWVMVTRSS